MHGKRRSKRAKRIKSELTSLRLPPKVRLLDLATTDLIEAAKTLRSGHFVSGKLVAQFEKEWAEYCNAKYCVATGGGGHALTLSLKSLRIPHDAYVLLPAFSYAATAMAVVEAGFRPVYCDVDSRGLMEEQSAREVYAKYNPKVIIPVHLYGQMVDMDWVMDLAGRAYVIEDAAQAHGSLTRVRGHAACFSFYPSKNLGACGEAGAILVNTHASAFRLRAMTNYGIEPGTRRDYIVHGGNYKMDEIQAAVLLSRLPKLDDANFVRGRVAQLYIAAGVKSYVRNSNYYLYPVLVDNPVEVEERMLSARVETGCHYGYILPHLAPLRQAGLWPKALQMSARTLSLPMGPHLSEHDVELVVEALDAVLSSLQC